MNIEQLEKLSCLKLGQENKEKIIKSLEGIFEMMKELDNTALPVEKSIHPILTQLVEDNFSNIGIVKKEEKTLGLHIESGHFLAPKVIKK